MARSTSAVVRMFSLVVGLSASCLIAQDIPADEPQQPTPAAEVKPEPVNAPSIIKRPALVMPVNRPSTPKAASTAPLEIEPLSIKPIVKEQPAQSNSELAEPKPIPADEPSTHLLKVPVPTELTIKAAPASESQPTATNPFDHAEELKFRKPALKAVPLQPIAPAKPVAEQPIQSESVTTPPAADTSGDIEITESKPTEIEQKPVVKSPSELPVEVVRERYPNTQIKIERQVTQDNAGNFINHGTWVQFDQRGRMLGGGEYRQGERHGRWTRLFNSNEGPLFSGPLFKEFQAPFTSEATFENDQLHGVWKVTDVKNRTVCIWHFEHGVQHGKSVWYGINGGVRRELFFEQGELHGDMLEYSPEGKITKRDTYLHGRKLVTQTDWHEPNAKNSEGQTLLAKEIIQPNFDFWNGIATFTVVRVEGKNQRHGKWSWWYKNGTKQMEGQFEFDQPQGEFTWWYPNGQKQHIAHYVDGKQDGQFVWWHANGIKMMSGEYLAGTQVNSWTRWHEDGKVREFARYSSTGEQIELKEFNIAKQEATIRPAATPAKTPQMAKQPEKLIEPGIKRR